jgi:hypothetical protein
MKYTLEDFKNKKIAVWVENKEEYGQFCIFARDIKWNGGEAVQDHTPSFPCEIVVGYRGGDKCTMTFDDIRGFHSRRRPSKYKSVTMAELEMGNDNLDQMKELTDSLINFVTRIANSGNPSELELRMMADIVNIMFGGK